MKRYFVILMCAILLAGCGAEQTVETVADEWVLPVMARPRQIRLELPGETSVCAMEGDSGRLYLGNGYEIRVQTLSSGDLDGTLRSLTGFSRENLTVVQTQSEPIRRYEFVWASSGEGGEQLCRGALLDDGDYHYCLTVLQEVDNMDTCQVVWDQVFQSFDAV